MSNHMTRVLVADGDREARQGAAFVLRRAGCSVVACPGAMSLVRAMDAHERGSPGGRLSVLVIASPLPQAGGIAELARLGVFALGVPVIVTLRALDRSVERGAIAAGATLVSTAGTETTASAVRHVIEQERRWGGEWISTGLLERLTS